MPLSIKNSTSNTIAEIRTIQIHGKRGVGNYALLFRLNLIPIGIHEEYVVRDSQLRVELQTINGNRILGWSNKDGTGVVHLNQYSGPHDVFFFMPLSTAQIEALEKQRAGGDLNIYVWFTGCLIQSGKLYDFSDGSAFSIPQQQWLATLGEMEFSRSLIFDIRFFDKNGAGSDSPEALLRNAWQHFHKGHYSDAVSHCRKAIEFVEQHNVDKVSASEAISKYKNHREDMTVIERMLFLREALKNVTQLGIHYTGDADFSRRQAQAILGATIALVADYELDRKID